ncbi:MAG: hypothetical protein RNU03_11165 [Candidatus Sedimenticola sp. (ex Thyasira tokunagai)]
MNNRAENGTRQNFDGKECVYYDGYWIRYYPEPEDTLGNRKKLIDNLTRRAFHHTETGINTPGYRMEEARAAYDMENDPARKRVNAAILAGALFNRATDIFTAIVNLEEQGVQITHGNELMKQCSNCFKEALELGKQVKHYSGQEGIDELWGEPFKAFTQPISQLFSARYRKIAQAMRDIDQIIDHMTEAFSGEKRLVGIEQVLREYGRASKLQMEIMKSDLDFFAIWPIYISSREKVEEFEPVKEDEPGVNLLHRMAKAKKLLLAGSSLITYISGARVPMPESTRLFVHRCEIFRTTCLLSSD